MNESSVILTDEAQRNIEAIFDWISERSPDGATRWYRALLKALTRLTTDPERLPIAPESHRFDRTVRDLRFRMRSGRTYRILFTVEGEEVHVLFVRAPGQDSAGS